MVEKPDKEIDLCLVILARLRAILHSDRIALASPCRTSDGMHIITYGPNLGGVPDILSLPVQSGAPCHRIIETNGVLRWSEISRRPRGIRCSMMQAEMLTAFLGVPVQDQHGTPVACLSVFSRLPRIWSRDELDELRYAAAALRSLMGDGLASSWHQALLSGQGR